MNQKKIAIYSGIVILAALCAFVFVAGGSKAATILTEGFESGGKTAYAAANVTQEEYLAPASIPYGGLRGTLVHTREGICHDKLAELFDKAMVTSNVVIALGRGRVKAYVD